MSHRSASTSQTQSPRRVGCMTGIIVSESCDLQTAGAADLKPTVKGFFDRRTFSIQYVVSDPTSKKCAIIDPVLDFDEKSGSTATRSADEILAYLAAERLRVEWILDTHPHADHFSAAQYLKNKTGAPTAIGDHVGD